MCTHNNNILVSIPSHPYVLLNRSILCDCYIEAESNFLSESLATCEEGNKPDLEMYFTVNLAFVNYLDLLNETIKTPIVRNWTMQKQILPISLEPFNSSLLQAPKTLKEFINQYKETKMNNKEINLPSKFRTFITSFIVDIVVFIAALLTLVITLTVIYLLSGQSKLKTLVANITLNCVKTVEATSTEGKNCDLGLINLIAIILLTETDIPNGEGFGYPPKYFTDPKFASTFPRTETEPSDSEGHKGKFIGDYCAACIKKYERCCCNASDWDANPIDLEQSNSPATDDKTNKQPPLSNIVKKELKSGQGLVL